MAFARPRAMSVPECPPSPPLIDYRQRHRGRLTALARRLHADGGIGAARRAHGQLAVLLAVEVQQRRPGDERRVEPARADALAADLLSHRHQQLERPVRQRRVLGQRHHRRDADSVVRAERRPVGGQPVAIAQRVRSCPRPDRSGCPAGAHTPCPGALGGSRSKRTRARRSPVRARPRCGPRPAGGRTRWRRPRFGRARSPALHGATGAQSWSAPRSVASTRGGSSPLRAALTSAIIASVRRPHHDDLRAVTADVVTAVMLRTAGPGDQADDAQHGEHDHDQHGRATDPLDVMTPPPRLRGRRRTDRSARPAAATPSADRSRRGHGRWRGRPSRRPTSG